MHVPETATAEAKAAAARVKQLVGKQARGHQNAKLVPEYKCVLVLEPEDADEEAFAVGWTDKLKLARKFRGSLLPVGSAILQRLNLNGVCGRRCVRVGVAWSPVEFMDECVLATHPFDGTNAVDDDTLQAAFDFCTRGPVATEKCRDDAAAE